MKRQHKDKLKSLYSSFSISQSIYELKLSNDVVLGYNTKEHVFWVKKILGKDKTTGFQSVTFLFQGSYSGRMTTTKINKIKDMVKTKQKGKFIKL